MEEFKIISHRANLDGPEKRRENTIECIDECINKFNFDVEIDLWFDNVNYYLGHDGGEFRVDFSWLQDRRKNLWIHCKDVLTINCLLNSKSNLNFFFHKNDDCVLTSNHMLWTYPNVLTRNNSIIVLEGFEEKKILQIISQGVFGFCTDYPLKLKELLIKNQFLRVQK